MKSILFSVIILGIIFASKTSNAQLTNVISEGKKPTQIRVGEGEGQVFISSPNTIAYNASNKHIYIGDRDSQIHILDEKLEYIGRFSRFGQGPGEIATISDLTVSKRGYIYICDYVNSRISTFDENGTYRSTIRLSMGLLTQYSRICVDSEGYPIIGFPFKKKLLTKYDLHGNVVEQIGEWLDKPWISNAKNPGFYNNVIFCLDSQSNYYVAFLSHPILRKYSNAGKLIFEIDLSKNSRINEYYSKYLNKMMDYSSTPAMMIIYLCSDIVYVNDVLYLYIYELIEDKPVQSLLKIDPLNGTVVGEIFLELKDEEGNPGRIDRLTCSHNIIFAVSKSRSAILKYNIQ